MYSFMFFLPFLQRENNFLFASPHTKALQNGATLKGKNLLLEKQILSFKELTPMGKGRKLKMAELLPLLEDPFTLKVNRFNPVNCLILCT